MDPLRALFDHHVWATLKLIDHCASLSPEQLEAAAPGTRGSIASTLVHLVSADQRYLVRMDGQEQAIPASAEGTDSLISLRAAMEQHAARWHTVIEHAAELNVTIPALPNTDPPWPEAPHAENLMFAQAIHHGNDHRTHICTILGSLGLEVPDLSGWQFWLEEKLG